MTNDEQGRPKRESIFIFDRISVGVLAGVAGLAIGMCAVGIPSTIHRTEQARHIVALEKEVKTLTQQRADLTDKLSDANDRALQCKTKSVALGNEIAAIQVVISKWAADPFGYQVGETDIPKWRDAAAGITC